MEKRILKIAGWLLLIAFFVCLSLFATYSIHSDYPLPFHSDEWDHLAIAKEIARTDSLINYNPYARTGWDPQWEQNYHVFLVLLLNATGWDESDLGLIDLSLFVPVFMTFLMVFFAFLLVRDITGSNIAGILAAVTILLTRPNVTILGYWFMVPMAYGMAFIPLMLLVFAKSFTTKKLRYFLILTILFAQTALVHPASAIIFLPAFFDFLMINPKLFVENKFKILLIVVELLALGFLLVGYSVYQYNFVGYQDLFNKALETSTFTTSLYEVQAFFSLPSFLTWPIVLLSCIGIAFLFLSKKKEAQIVPLFVLTLLPLLYLFFSKGTIYLADYRRMFLYIATVMAMLSGVGIYAIVSFLNNFLKKKLENIYFLSSKLPAIRIPQILMSLVVIWFLVGMLLVIPFTHEPFLYRVIEKEDIPAILWLKYHSTPEDVVLAMPWHSRAINVIAGTKILYANPARLTGPRAYQEAAEFWAVGCEERKQRLFGPPTFVYSREFLACDFLKEVYAKDGRYIYKVEVT